MATVTVVRRYEKDGDQYIRVRLSDGRVMYEHRFIVEQRIGRRLRRDEHVHHRDGNKRNNAEANLEMLSISDHSAEHGKENPAATVILACPACGNRFERTLRYIRGRKDQTRFFCSRSCRLPSGQVPHGTAHGYRYHGCRCALCRAATTKAQREYKASKRRANRFQGPLAHSGERRDGISEARGAEPRRSTSR